MKNILKPRVGVHSKLFETVVFKFHFSMLNCMQFLGQCMRGLFSLFSKFIRFSSFFPVQKRWPEYSGALLYFF